MTPEPVGPNFAERVRARVSGAPLREGNRLHLLKNGPRAFDEWVTEIERAERWCTSRTSSSRRARSGARSETRSRPKRARTCRRACSTTASARRTPRQTCGATCEGRASTCGRSTVSPRSGARVRAARSPQVAGRRRRLRLGRGDLHRRRVDRPRAGHGIALTDWELDVLVEGEASGAQMEDMFEDDLADSREMLLDGAGRSPKPDAEHRVERPRARHGHRFWPVASSGSGSRALASAARAGGAAFTGQQRAARATRADGPGGRRRRPDRSGARGFALSPLRRLALGRGERPDRRLRTRSGAVAPKPSLPARVSARTRLSIQSERLSVASTG